MKNENAKLLGSQTYFRRTDTYFQLILSFFSPFSICCCYIFKVFVVGQRADDPGNYFSDRIRSWSRRSVLTMRTLWFVVMHRLQKGGTPFHSHQKFWWLPWGKPVSAARIVDSSLEAWYSPFHSGTLLHYWWFHKTYSSHRSGWKELQNWQCKRMLCPFATCLKFSLWSGCRGVMVLELVHIHLQRACYILTFTPYVFLNSCSSKCSLVLFHLSKFDLFFKSPTEFLPLLRNSF